jgi:actin-related protein
LDPKFGALVFNSSKAPTEEDFQIKLSVERFRGSEIIFQPSIVGLECEGISEIFENMLSYFGKQEYRQLLLDYVLLTGGNSMVKGFDARIKQELVMLNPSNSKINVVRALNAELDAWRGGALFCKSEIIENQALQEYSISKA